MKIIQKKNNRRRKYININVIKAGFAKLFVRADHNKNFIKYKTV